MRLDVTVRILTPRGAGQDAVVAAVRRACHGSRVTEFQIHWVDWQRVNSRDGRTTSRGHGTAKNLEAMARPLLRGRWRVARVAE
jgi:hypothetical protein